MFYLPSKHDNTVNQPTANANREAVMWLRHLLEISVNRIVLEVRRSKLGYGSVCVPAIEFVVLTSDAPLLLVIIVGAIRTRKYILQVSVALKRHRIVRRITCKRFLITILVL